MKNRPSIEVLGTKKYDKRGHAQGGLGEKQKFVARSFVEHMISFQMTPNTQRWVLRQKNEVDFETNF